MDLQRIYRRLFEITESIRRPTDLAETPDTLDRVPV